MSTVRNKGVLTGSVRVMNGMLQDAIIPMEDKKELVVGRDVNVCNLVFEAPWISRCHCRIVYSKEEQVYRVTDLSENGTFTEDKGRLIKNEETILVLGTKLSLGEDGIVLQLV